MRTIVAGSRTCKDGNLVHSVIKSCPWNITEIVSGCAKGPDSFAIQYAIENNIPLVQFPADWEKFGRGAGFIRNRKMAEYAEALIAIWDGISRGTGNMIDTARALKLRVYVYME